MFVSIDWVSFTFEMQLEQSVMAFELWGRAALALNAQFPLASRMLVDGHNFTPRLGRAPYNASQQRDDNGVMIFAHQRLPHSLVEVGGIGLDALGSPEAELALVSEVKARLTRMDVAVDIFTEVRPDEFAAHRTSGKFKAWSEAVSSSGHTIYVGSRTSDRYARVYRYNEPHPRSQFLRVEHVLKAEQARLAASQIGELGMDRFVALIGNTFGWTHPIWSPVDNTSEAAAAWRPERRQGKTVAWVYGSVLPCLARLTKEGALEWTEVRKYMQSAGIDITSAP